MPNSDFQEKLKLVILTLLFLLSTLVSSKKSKEPSKKKLNLMKMKICTMKKQNEQTKFQKGIKNCQINKKQGGKNEKKFGNKKCRMCVPLGFENV